MKGKKGKAVLALSLLSLALGGCSNPETPSSSLEPSSNQAPSSEASSLLPASSSAPVAVSSLSLNLEKTSLEIGETLKLTANVLPEEADDKSVVYSTSNSSIASLEGSTLTAVGKGEVEITATSVSNPSVSDTKTITIHERRNTVSDREFLDSLVSDAYSHDSYPTSEGWGVTDPEAIGVDQDRLENETLYPVPTEGVTEYLASDYGISETEQNNAGKLTNLLNSLAEVEGTKVIRFGKGTYPFANIVSASNVKDCYLVGEEGTKFVYSTWCSFIVLTRCENFHLNSITFDINPSPTITGTVVRSEEDSSNGYIYLKPDEGYDLSNPTYQNYNVKKTGSYAEYYFDEEYQSYVPNRSGNLFYNPGLKDLSYDSSEGLLKVTLSKSFWASSFVAPKVGTIASVAFQVYENHGFYFKECTNTYMEHVTAYTVGGMGMRTDNGKNVYLNHVRFIREPGTKRLLTCTADILHTCNLEGDAVFTNCILEGSHDDAINVKSFYTKINMIRGNVVTVGQTQTEVTIGFSVGDEVDVYDPTGMKYKDTFTVTKVEQIGTSFDLTLDRNMPSRGSNSYVGFSLGNATKAVHLSLENSLIKNKRNRGILLQGRHSSIKGCTFENVNMGAVQVLGVDDTFKEAIVPQDITLSGNKFLNCWDDLSIFTYDEDGVATPGTLKNVNVTNNLFYHGTGTTLWLRGTGNVKVEDNLFYENLGKSYSCRIQDSQDIEFNNNAYYFDQRNTGYNFLSSASSNTNVTSSGNALKGAL